MSIEVLKLCNLILSNQHLKLKCILGYLIICVVLLFPWPLYQSKINKPITKNTKIILLYRNQIMPTFKFLHNVANGLCSH